MDGVGGAEVEDDVLVNLGNIGGEVEHDDGRMSVWAPCPTPVNDDLSLSSFRIQSFSCDPSCCESGMEERLAIILSMLPAMICSNSSTDNCNCLHLPMLVLVSVVDAAILFSFFLSSFLSGSIHTDSLVTFRNTNLTPSTQPFLLLILIPWFCVLHGIALWTNDDYYFFHFSCFTVYSLFWKLLKLSSSCLFTLHFQFSFTFCDDESLSPSFQYNPLLLLASFLPLFLSSIFMKEGAKTYTECCDARWDDG